ncbi:tRNA pseudouridine(13) synthase TruD [Pseudomonadota bacterium]
MTIPTPTLTYVQGPPTASGRLRSTPEDFQVDEVLGFDLTGEGEHVCLHIRKRNNNTAFIAKQIVRLAGVKNMDVSYAGLKDRNAVTTQWFSIYLSNKPEPDWSQLNSDEVEVLQVKRHNRKLRRGALKGNQFKLIVRELAGELDGLDERIKRVAEQGVPNYFGEQRFGHDGDNLEKARGMFAGEFKVKNRDKRSIYLSAARSQIFNHVLSTRVENGSWNQALNGDVMMLNGSHSVFAIDNVDDDIIRRVAEGDIHPSGPLWGRGTLASQTDVLTIEQGVAEQYEVFCDGLEKVGMKQERRSLCLPVADLEWCVADDNLSIAFFLPAGCYATTVLRELLRT